MKGKGFEITAKNIVNGDPTELARPLTTDEWDNVLLYEGCDTNQTGNQDGIH